MDHEATPRHFDLAMEQAVLGSILRDPTSAPAVFGALLETDFYLPRHRLLFRVMRELEDRRTGSADAVTVAHALDRGGRSDEAGGRAYLEDLMLAVPSLAFLENHIEAVRCDSARRQVVTAAERILRESSEPGFDPWENARRADLELLDLLADEAARAPATIEAHALALRARVEQMVPAEKAPPTASTPIRMLNELLDGGFRPGQLVVVGGRPGTGKSVFAQDVAELTAEHSWVDWFSLEMRAEEILERHLVRRHGSVARGPRALFGQGAAKWLDETAGSIRDTARLLLRIHDQPNLDVNEIRARSLAARRRGGLGLVVVDYIQLMQPAEQRRNSNRAQEVGEMSRRLKVLANEASCPVMVLAQLNREVEHRADPTPKLSDLRESGSLEQDADIVLFCCEGEIVVAKNRRGECDRVPATFEKPRFRWTTYTVRFGEDVL